MELIAVFRRGAHTLGALHVRFLITQFKDIKEVERSLRSPMTLGFCKDSICTSTSVTSYPQ